MTKRDIAQIDSTDMAAFLGGADIAVESGRRSRTWLLPSAVLVAGERGSERIVPKFEGPAKFAAEREMRGLLGAFVALENASPEKVARFARRGALAINDDGVPFGKMAEPTRLHWYREYALLLAATLRTATRAQHGRSIHDDDVDVFRRFVAREMAAVKSAAAGAASRQAGHEVVRLVLANAKDVQLARETVSAVVNWWTVVGGLHPVMWWNGAAAEIGWSGGPWGALGAQLATTVARQLGEPRCGYCDNPIKGRPRRAKANQIPCCDDPDCVRRGNAERQRRSRAERAKARGKKNAATRKK